MKKLGEVAEGMLDLPEALKARLKGCLDCGKPGTWGGSGVFAGRCQECGVRRSVEEDSRIEKAKALFRMGVPAAYRVSPPWLESAWQFDPAWPDGTCSAWPVAAMEGGPWCLTLSGVNGSGKSVAAAHLLSILWRAGHRPATTDASTPLPMWIGELELVDEDRIAGFGEPRHLRQSVFRQSVLVWDDLGSSDAWRTVFPLIESRHGNGGLTIFTTHRPLSAAKASALGVPGSSIEESAPEIYSRLRSGWIGRWADKSYRGKAVEVPA